VPVQARAYRNPPLTQEKCRGAREKTLPYPSHGWEGFKEKTLPYPSHRWEGFKEKTPRRPENSGGAASGRVSCCRLIGRNDPLSQRLSASGFAHQRGGAVRPGRRAPRDAAGGAGAPIGAGGGGAGPFRGGNPARVGG